MGTHGLFGTVFYVHLLHTNCVALRETTVGNLCLGRIDLLLSVTCFDGLMTRDRSVGWHDYRVFLYHFR
jgi:hypothetical protein